jgi:uncharacterized protein (UPF0548 family)
VFLFRQPTDVVIHAFLQVQARLDFTYPETGATAAIVPVSYVVDHTRIRLGTGEEVFCRAKIGLQGWKQFDLGWLKAFPANTPIRSGEVVAVVARTFCLWSVNAARIVYVTDEPRRFGFAYGTLPGHVETGEERFLVERTDDDSVWYDILAFSQPRHLLTKIGYPLARLLQKRFGRESAAAMVRAVSDTLQ